jgi:hypothetical protein
VTVIGPILVISSIFFALNRKGNCAKKRVEDEKLSAADRDMVAAERKRKLQETDEIITVLLPVVRDN